MSIKSPLFSPQYYLESLLQFLQASSLNSNPHGNIFSFHLSFSSGIFIEIHSESPDNFLLHALPVRSTCQPHKRYA